MIQKELEKVLLNEALASCRYQIFAEQAREEGLHYIAKIFEETSRNELSHVREMMKMMNLVNDTATNLAQSIENENMESTDIYPHLRELAVIDNDKNTARFFQQLTKIEEQHKERFEQLLQLLENNSVYKRDKPIRWKCRTCGYIHEGCEPPNKCPGCQSVKYNFEPEDFSI